jgi:2-keto-4-pentenoate hydratase/2-oxohepta-3-ene-1,7-dioic acid hydratase in catechol pathway
MRICRYITSDTSTPRYGLVESDQVVDLGDAPIDLGSLELSGRRGASVPLADVGLCAPVEVPNFLAIGLNYRAHVAEGGRADPETPVVFNKQISCIVGPHDPIHVPAASPDVVDYEGELGIVIGRPCRHVPASRAMEVIAGYVVVNDVSVRDWQRATPTMTMGKSWDTHGPIGPWMVTPDEIDDPMNLRIVTTVDGEVRQDGNTSQMIFGIAELIEHLSTAFTLLPGTVIATGTPEGVGIYREPPAMLQPGQTVTITIDGIGSISNPVIAEPNPECRIG